MPALQNVTLRYFAGVHLSLESRIIFHVVFGIEVGAVRLSGEVAEIARSGVRKAILPRGLDLVTNGR